MTSFTYRSARSGAVLFGFGLAIAVETLALHLYLAARHHPLAAWLLTASSLSAIAWLAADYRALGRGAVRVMPDALELNVGRRFSAVVPRSTVTAATQPTWRDLPSPSAAAAAGYLNMTKPAAPNVLVALDAPAEVRISGGIRRRARLLGLHLDDPAGFLEALGAPAPSPRGVADGRLPNVVS